jgi:hypothetical protein
MLYINAGSGAPKIKTGTKCLQISKKFHLSSIHCQYTPDTIDFITTSSQKGRASMKKHSQPAQEPREIVNLGPGINLIDHIIARQ